MSKRVLAIVGATGSGKAGFAVALARRLDLPLLSCDSMKVYRDMDIGTAKPDPALREGVTWHGLDLVWPWETFNASMFVDLFESLLDPVRPLIVSGGTMLYLKAATEGLGVDIPRDDAVRARLREEAQELGNEALHERLRQVDPPSADRVHPNDLRRIVRALEVHELTGRPLTSFHGQFGRERDDLQRTVVVVERAREDMDARIDARVEQMFARGWIDECRSLLADPRGVSQEATQALGYRQIFDWLRSGETEAPAELVSSIQTATRRFARRQLTWLGHLVGDVHRLTLESGQEPADRLDEVLSWV